MDFGHLCHMGTSKVCTPLGVSPAAENFFRRSFRPVPISPGYNQVYYVPFQADENPQNPQRRGRNSEPLVKKE